MDVENTLMIHGAFFARESGKASSPTITLLINIAIGWEGRRMPEGPEVRKYAMDLAKRVSGRTLQEVRLLSGRYLSKPPGGLEGLRSDLPIDIVGTGAHGKFLYWILKDEHSIWNTLGMSGRWSPDQGKYSRVQFVLNDGNVFFDDIRNFGTLKFVRG
ncbi:MAG TPA: hypothetical protein EYG51_21225, partial [Pseudomonadales bacterium]|nr:hypothetical protein [Pseudomonadales bacterium]